MHKIDRNCVSVPPCLCMPEGGYGSLSGKEKAEIRAALFSIQGQRCAYCERLTGTDATDGHIEHFRKQAKHAHLDLDWHNLFWSCNDEWTCGKHKDKCEKGVGRFKPFDSDDIIDPAREDPESLLLFVSDGSVRPREGLSDKDRHRAEETLRIFQLTESVLLRTSRRTAVSHYIGALEALRVSAPDYLPVYVQGELDRSTTMPFSTAIKSFLESVVKS